MVSPSHACCLLRRGACSGPASAEAFKELAGKVDQFEKVRKAVDKLPASPCLRQRTPC